MFSPEEEIPRREGKQPVVVETGIRDEPNPELATKDSVAPVVQEEDSTGTFGGLGDLCETS